MLCRARGPQVTPCTRRTFTTMSPRITAVRQRRAGSRLHLECSLVKQLSLTAAGAAAIGAAVVALQRMQQQQPRQQQGGRAGPQRGQRGGGSGAAQQLGRLLQKASWPPAQIDLDLKLDWPLQDKEKQLLKTVSEIERLQQKAAVRELRRWDQRWELRTKTLPELRALAQKHSIAGRSRMRKQELVAALEAKLGLVHSPPCPPTAQ